MIAPVGTCLALLTVPPLPAPSSPMILKSSALRSNLNSIPISNEASCSFNLTCDVEEKAEEGKEGEEESEFKEGVEVEEALDVVAQRGFVGKRCTPSAPICAGETEAGVRVPGLAALSAICRPLTLRCEGQSVVSGRASSREGSGSSRCASWVVRAWPQLLCGGWGDCEWERERVEASRGVRSSRTKAKMMQRGKRAVLGRSLGRRGASRAVAALLFAEEVRARSSGRGSVVTRGQVHAH